METRMTPTEEMVENKINTEDGDYDGKHIIKFFVIIQKGNFLAVLFLVYNEMMSLISYQIVGVNLQLMDH